MPLALTPVPVANQFDACKSVLIVPCHVCPKMCLAAEKNEPIFDVMPGKGPDYFGRYIEAMRKDLLATGVESGVFKAPASAPMMCLWPQRVRDRLARESGRHDAIAVIGCESAVASAAGAVAFSRKPVIPMSRCEGIANFVTRFRGPCRIELEAAPCSPVPWK